MHPVSDPRDIRPVASPASSDGSAGRNVITVIGIDRYRHWRPLNNAVRDANATRALLRRLGFWEITEPLLDDLATGDAIDALVTDELTALSQNDSLIVFYAGHGGARTQHIGGKQVTTGYLIPVDGANASNRVSTWIELDAWLRRIAKLPPRHILVILDACYSGIALSPVVKWGRDGGATLDLPFTTLQARPSRLVITSALNDEIAMDSGPVHGHSLFTGCLIEALTGGVPGVDLGGGRRMVTGSDLGDYIRRRVQAYPGVPGWRQTPDFGSFDFDERGEMLIPLLLEGDIEQYSSTVRPQGIPVITITIVDSGAGGDEHEHHCELPDPAKVVQSTGLEITEPMDQPPSGPRRTG